MMPRRSSRRRPNNQDDQNEHEVPEANRTFLNGPLLPTDAYYFGNASDLGHHVNSKNILRAAKNGSITKNDVTAIALLLKKGYIKPYGNTSTHFLVDFKCISEAYNNAKVDDSSEDTNNVHVLTSNDYIFWEQLTPNKKRIYENRLNLMDLPQALVDWDYPNLQNEQSSGRRTMPRRMQSMQTQDEEHKIEEEQDEIPDEFRYDENEQFQINSEEDSVEIIQRDFARLRDQFKTSQFVKNSKEDIKMYDKQFLERLGLVVKYQNSLIKNAAISKGIKQKHRIGAVCFFQTMITYCAN